MEDQGYSREAFRQERERERERRNREREEVRREGDHGNNSPHKRPRSRSRSPSRDYNNGRRPLPPQNDRRRGRGGGGGSGGGRNRDRRPPRRGGDDRSKTPESPQAMQDRDRRTVFVQQLAARLRTKELYEFFDSKAGPVRDASIVKDRVTNRSKGVAYVEFVDIETVQKAIELTGTKLLGIPVIVQHTEAEKNRQAAAAAAASRQQQQQASGANAEKKGGNTPNSAEDLINSARTESRKKERTKLVVGNVDERLTEAEILEPFREHGEVYNFTLGRDIMGKFKGYALLEFVDADAAKRAITSLHGSELGGRALRVSFDDDDRKKSGGDENGEVHDDGENDDTNGEEDESSATTDTNTQQASRCLILHNMFDPDSETGDSWVQELEEDVKEDCEEKYGPVLHINVDAQSKDGEIYIKFENENDGAKAIKALQGQKFDGRVVRTEPMIEMLYKIKFPKS